MSLVVEFNHRRGDLHGVAWFRWSVLCSSTASHRIDPTTITFFSCLHDSRWFSQLSGISSGASAQYRYIQCSSHTTLKSRWTPFTWFLSIAPALGQRRLWFSVSCLSQRDQGMDRFESNQKVRSCRDEWREDDYFRATICLRFASSKYRKQYGRLEQFPADRSIRLGAVHHEFQRPRVRVHRIRMVARWGFVFIDDLPEVYRTASTILCRANGDGIGLSARGRERRRRVAGSDDDSALVVQSCLSWSETWEHRSRSTWLYQIDRSGSR